MPFVERVAVAAVRLSEGREHPEDPVDEISSGIWWRGERFGLSA
jgi:hypothetical protein